MSRKYESNNDNTFGFSYNFSIAKPFDTREVVNTYNDLINSDTWKQGNVYIHYKGMKVSCADTGAIYVYIGENGSVEDVKNTENWIAQGAESQDIDLSGYYTKTETDNMLNKKTDDNTLSSVAKSGDYNDLTNKPEIPVYSGGSFITIKDHIINVDNDLFETYFNSKYDAKGSASTVQNNLNLLSSNVYLKTETYSKAEIEQKITKAIEDNIINVINYTEF